MLKTNIAVESTKKRPMTKSVRKFMEVVIKEHKTKSRIHKLLLITYYRALQIRIWSFVIPLGSGMIFLSLLSKYTLNFVKPI